MTAGRRADGPWLWRAAAGRAEARFVGRGPGDRAAAAAAAGVTGDIAWTRQVHSPRVLDARAGRCGEADALVSDLPGLALSVVTADCVPILLATERRIAAVHAGWRGIAAGIVDAVLDRFDPASGEPTAWLGPAIGACCYEVCEEVAARVAAASEPAVIRPGRRERPHLDLAAAVRAQLHRRGVERLQTVELCTRCHPESFWSYRREGPGAGRNHGFIWLRPEPLCPDRRAHERS